MSTAAGRTTRCHVVVVGGGIAGLAAARELLVRRPGLQVTVLEGAASVGGKLRVGQVAGVDVDLGAEAMLARRPEAVDLARAVGLGGDLVHPAVTGAGLWTRGAVRPLPRTLMGVPADVRVAVRAGVLGRVGAARARLETRMPRPDLTEDTSIGALVSRRLGREVRDRLVDPLVGGVYAGRCDELSVHAAWPQVAAAARRHGGLLAAAAAESAATRAGELPQLRGPDAAANDDAAGSGVAAGPGVAPLPSAFAGVAGGVGRLAEATAADIHRRGGRVRCGFVVRELCRTSSGGWRLVVGSAAHPATVAADAVVVAVPAAPAARLLVEVAPSAARELTRIEYASLAIVTVAMRTADVGADLRGSGFLVPPIDDTTIKASTYSSLKWAWFPDELLVLRCSVGRHGDEAELQRDDTELVGAAMGDLREATGLHAPLVDAVVTRWGGALPQYAVGHLDRVVRVRRAVDAVDRLEVCGAAYDGVGIPAAIATGQGAATRVVEQLETAATMGP